MGDMCPVAGQTVFRVKPIRPVAAEICHGTGTEKAGSRDNGGIRCPADRRRSVVLGLEVLARAAARQARTSVDQARRVAGEASSTSGSCLSPRQ